MDKAPPRYAEPSLQVAEELSANSSLMLPEPVYPSIHRTQPNEAISFIRNNEN